MSELQPTQESDVLVAETMGWRWYLSRVSPKLRVFLPPDGCVTDRVPWDGDPTVTEGKGIAQPVRPQYTTDVALVEPMIKRLSSLGEKRWVNVAYDPFKGVWMSHCYPGLQAQGKSANLVIGELLLQVWEEVRTQ